MNKDFIIHISDELKHNKDIDLKYQINEIQYKVKFLATDINKGINISSILAIPLAEDVNNQIIVESNNLESENFQEIIEQGIQAGVRLAKLTSNLPAPIVIPLIPSYKNYPYLQQLSKECFSISSDDKNYRIDEQVVKIISKAKIIIEEENGLVVKDKIFLNGYSSSGVFAQRFALLHPDIIETACIGGASGSIPIPTDYFAYPLGIADYESLTGEKFDLKSYSNIKFRYYVGEFETQNKSDSRVDDFGQPAPMHDMSYFNRSVPTEVGKYQRKILGTEMFSRAENTIQILKNMGINISHKIIWGRSHNNRSGIGVNELGDRFINDTYNSTIENYNVNLGRTR